MSFTIPKSPSNPRGISLTQREYESVSLLKKQTEVAISSDEQSKLSPFFNKPGDIYSVPNDPIASCQPLFKHPLFSRIRSDATELVRESCKRLSKKSKHIEINYELLAKYAAAIDVNESQHAFSPFHIDLHSRANNLSERDIINMSCLFVMVPFGSGVTPLLQPYYKDSRRMIGDGLWAIYKKYKSLSVDTLSALSMSDIAQLFAIDSHEYKKICEKLHQCIRKMVLILRLKHFTDFADYVYYCLDLSWIKSQTADLSAITTIEYEVNNNNNKLGITLAPTLSKVISRCVITDFKATRDVEQNALYKHLIENRAFLYAVNDRVVYKKPFKEVISIIRSYLKSSREDDYTVDGKKMIALQFGMNSDRAPETMQTFLYNLINDFSVLNDPYLYNKNLKVYLFQSAQSLVMELYYNVYVAAPEAQRNPIFNFRGIRSLTAVVDNIIPFVLLRDGVIKVRAQFKEEFDAYIGSGCALKTACDLETEIIASAIYVMEIMVQLRNPKKDDMNIAKLVYSLRNRG